MNIRRSFSVLAVALIASATLGTTAASAAPPSEAADATAVTHWNEVAVTTLAAFPGPNGGAPPALQINMAMTQGAVYDAVNAIGPKKYQQYLLNPRFGAKASVDAAVATAAYEMLTNIIEMTPELGGFANRGTLKESVLAQYTTALGAIDDGASKERGIAAGSGAADAMIAAREDDGRFGPSQWVRDPRAGHWSPLINPMTGQEALDPTPWAGAVDPFLLESPSQFRSAPPLALDSPAYAAEFAEVQSLGRATNSTRTEHQTYVARWWEWAPILAWNEVARELITRNGLGAADAARLLALQNMSGADALINCWNDKYYYDFWRPWNAIVRAGEDGNDATVAEPSWTALITAPYPDHPSGHNCNDGAQVAVLRMWFGDAIAGGFEMTSTSTFLTTEPRVRTFATFSQPLAELIEARIWAGLHFRHPDVEGQLLGLRVAQYGAAHYFQPVRR